MSMFPIASITITSNGTNPTFTSIPQNFKHLQLRCYLRAAGATSYQYVYHLPREAANAAQLYSPSWRFQGFQPSATFFSLPMLYSN